MKRLYRSMEIVKLLFDNFEGEKRAGTYSYKTERKPAKLYHNHLSFIFNNTEFKTHPVRKDQRIISDLPHCQRSLMLLTGVLLSKGDSTNNYLHLQFHRTKEVNA